MLRTGLWLLTSVLVCAPNLVSCGGSSDGGTTSSTNGGDGDGDSTSADADGGTSTGDGDGDGTSGDGDGDGTTGDGDGDTTAGDGDGDEPGFTPDPALEEDCDALCATLAEAECPNSDEFGCNTICQVASANPECAELYSGLFECAETAEPICNEDGEAELDGCQLEQVSSALCFLTTTDEELEEPCANYCEKAVAADCDDDSQGDCELGCGVAGSFIPDCTDAWAGYLECTEDIDTFVCNEDGEAGPDGGCEGPALLYWACVFGALAEE